MRKFPHKQHLSISDDVAAIILAGGQGTRLFPLTQARCKPAVVFGGRYRLIDVPISNSLNSGIKQIYVISQYFSSSLNHHIKETFSLDSMQGGSIHFLYPEENQDGLSMYQGTADAIRKNLPAFENCTSDYFLILSGDQLYNMDLFAMLEFAKKKDADLTIAALSVKEKEARRMGLLKINDSFDILDFYEKPTDPEILNSFELSSAFFKHKKTLGSSTNYLGSMGIYIFKKEALFKLLRENNKEDFGKNIIPSQIKKGKSAVFYYEGYWEDIGTIASYYEATLALTRNQLGLDLYNEALPIFSHAVNLPCARINHTIIDHSIVSQGSMIDADKISNSLLGLRSIVKEGTIISHSIIMGNQYYTPPASLKEKLPEEFSIGKNCKIEKAIIDEHVKIGNNVQLINKQNLDHYDGENIYIRDGIIVVPSGSVLPDGFVL